MKLANVFGIISAKTITKIVIAAVANETYSAPKTFIAKAVAIEEFRVFTKFVPIKTVEISWSSSDYIL